LSVHYDDPVSSVSMELVNSTKSLKKQHEKDGDPRFSGGLFHVAEKPSTMRF